MSEKMKELLREYYELAQERIVLTEKMMVIQKQIKKEENITLCVSSYEAVRETPLVTDGDITRRRWLPKTRRARDWLLWRKPLQELGDYRPELTHRVIKARG